MGHELGSYTKRGISCYKCKKPLLSYRKIKGREDVERATFFKFNENAMIHVVNDPSRGTSSGWFYGYICEDCWREELKHE